MERMFNWLDAIDCDGELHSLGITIIEDEVNCYKAIPLKLLYLFRDTFPE